MNPIRVAHTRYATGAAAPSPAATVAGIKKIEDAMVTLTMLAVSSRVPIARTSCGRGSSAVITVADVVFRQLMLQHEHRHDEVHLPEAIARALNGERPKVRDMPVLHPFPDLDADVDALWKVLIE